MTLDAGTLAFARRCRVALFASRSPRGAPFLTPLWVVERSGHLCCTTAASSITVRNVEANGEALLLLYPGRAGGDEHTLRLRGRATVRRGRLPLGVVLAMARKYYLSPAALASELGHARLWSLRARYYAHAEPALLEFTPEAAEWADVPTRDA